MSGTPTNPEATDVEAIRKVVASREPHTYEEHHLAAVALDALLTERDALKKERWQERGIMLDLQTRAEAAEATLTRYRNALERIAGAGASIPDWRAMEDIARAALDGPKEEET